MSNNTIGKAPEEQFIATETQVTKHVGVLTFEDSTSKFDGKTIKKNDSIFIAPALIIALYILMGIVFCFTYQDKWLDISFMTVVFATASVFMYFSLLYMKPLVDTPYGNIYYDSSINSILYPNIDTYSGKLDYQSIKVQEDLGVNCAAQKFYMNKIKYNPELWLQYVFYHEQAVKLEKIIKGLPKPPAPEQEQLEWYTTQRDHHYDLFINAQNEVTPE